MFFFGVCNCNGSIIFCNLSHFNVSFMKCLTGLIGASCGQLGWLLRAVPKTRHQDAHLTDGPMTPEPYRHGNLKELSNGLANGSYHADDNGLPEWILGQLINDALPASVVLPFWSPQVFFHLETTPLSVKEGEVSQQTDHGRGMVLFQGFSRATFSCCIENFHLAGLYRMVSVLGCIFTGNKSNWSEMSWKRKC